jgi:hypothetical protein
MGKAIGQMVGHVYCAAVDVPLDKAKKLASQAGLRAATSDVPEKARGMAKAVISSLPKPTQILPKRDKRKFDKRLKSALAPEENT